MPHYTIPLNPVPASRVRVGRYGNYYAGPYEKFRKAAVKMLPEMFSKIKPLQGPLAVTVTFHREQPGKTELDFPPGDIDNYTKAIFDSLNEIAWSDDKQIVSVTATKTWATKGEPGRIEIEIEKFIWDFRNGEFKPTKEKLSE